MSALIKRNEELEAKHTALVDGPRKKIQLFDEIGCGDAADISSGWVVEELRALLKQD